MDARDKPGQGDFLVPMTPFETIEIDLNRDEPIDAVVVDSSYGLPPAGAALAHARDASLAIPVQEGDLDKRGPFGDPSRPPGPGLVHPSAHGFE